MSCEEYRETILEFAIDATERQRIGEALAHVNSCRDCQATLADFDRIVRSLENDAVSRNGHESDATANRPTPLSKIRGAVRSWLGWRASVFVSAAVILFTGTSFWIGQRSAWLRQEGSGQAKSTGSPVGLISLKPASHRFAMDQSDVVHDTLAFAEVSEVFDGRARWMLVSNSADTASSRDMELLDQPVDTRHQLDVLRLTMLRENQVVSSVDLVIVPGQSADLTVMLPAGNTVHYRAGTSSGVDPRLNLLAEIRPAPKSGFTADAAGDKPRPDPPVAGFPTATLFTTMDLQLGRPISAGALQTTSGRYELCSALCRASLPIHPHPQPIEENFHG